MSGHSKHCLEVIVNFIKNILQKYSKQTHCYCRVFKTLENIYRSVNIGFINEMKMIADKMGIDVFKIIEAVTQNHMVLEDFGQVLELVVIVYQLTRCT